MTYKKATMGVPVGGAKAGIWEDPNVSGPRREAIFRAFGKAMKPLYKANIVLYGSDMGVNDPDVKIFREEARLLSHLPKQIIPRSSGMESPWKIILRLWSGGFRQRSMQIFRNKYVGARVAIEGFGKVGGALPFIF